MARIRWDLWWDHLLNCGFRLPASTGSDWYICSANRVYTQMENSFSYDGWLETLAAGRSVITNGPHLELTADGYPPGHVLDLRARQPQQVGVEVRWQAHLPVECVEIIMNGQRSGGEHTASGSKEGKRQAPLPRLADGWKAALSPDKAGTATAMHMGTYQPHLLQTGSRIPPRESAQSCWPELSKSYNGLRSRALSKKLSRQRITALP